MSELTHTTYSNLTLVTTPVLLAAKKHLHLTSNDNLTVVTTREPFDIWPGRYQHDSYGLVIPLNGSPRVSLDNTPAQFLQGYLHPINAGQVHGTLEPIHNASLLLMRFTTSFLQGIALDLYGNEAVSLDNSPVPQDPSFKALLDLFMFELNQDNVGHAFMLDSLSAQMAIHLLRKSMLGASEPVHVSNNGHHARIRMAVDFMEENLAEDFSISDVANVTNLSQFHFMRIFKGEMGRTPHEYLLEMRLEKARHLLTSTNQSITAVFLSSGFKNHSHFTRVFKKKIGLSPSAYRRQE